MIFEGPLSHVAAVIVCTLVVGELIAYRWLRQRGYTVAEARASLILVMAGLMTRSVGGGCIGAVMYFLWSYRITEVPLDAWWGWLGLFLGLEFFYYWGHRAAHAIRWLWASHAVHHSPQHLNVLASCRIVANDLLAGRWIFLLPLVVIGFEPVAVFTMLGINQIYQIWIHTELVPKLGSLEYILNTPSNHRVHHAINPEYIGRNLGGILIVFDRLFGTYADERGDVPCRYGLPHQVGSNNPVWIVLHEWIAMVRDLRRSHGFEEVCGYLLGRPGWRPKRLATHLEELTSRNAHRERERDSTRQIAIL
jgi:sterol desaturase/sphingolipid hydroxylase (fatty acid hydroxylase superfamily)